MLSEKVKDDRFYLRRALTKAVDALLSMQEQVPESVKKSDPLVFIGISYDLNKIRRALSLSLNDDSHAGDLDLEDLLDNADVALAKLDGLDLRAIFLNAGFENVFELGNIRTFIKRRKELLAQDTKEVEKLFEQYAPFLEEKRQDNQFDRLELQQKALDVMDFVCGKLELHLDSRVKGEVKRSLHEINALKVAVKLLPTPLVSNYLLEKELTEKSTDIFSIQEQLETVFLILPAWAKEDIGKDFKQITLITEEIKQRENQREMTKTS